MDTGDWAPVSGKPEGLPPGVDLYAPFRVTDLKQWVYCPRILYYHTCLPDVRPVTYKMEAGIEQGRREEGRDGRRSLRLYDLKTGRRRYNFPVWSGRLGLRGEVDMVIWTESGGEETVIPVDFKLSRTAGKHFKLQLAAYGLLLEEQLGVSCRRGFLYFIQERRAEEVKLDSRLRGQLLAALDAMHRMLGGEGVPPPTSQRAKCLACEFRRFCNDVV